MEKGRSFSAEVSTLTLEKTHNELEELLEEVQCWAEKEKLDVNLFERNNALRKSKCAKAQTVDLSHVDIVYLKKVLASCKDEFVKVRIPMDLNVSYNIMSLYDNNSAECRRREKAKAIAEYLV